MTVLKKSDRQEVLIGVLTAAFKPRFNAIQAALIEFAKRKIADAHPVFYAAFADEALRPYLATTTVRYAYIGDENQAKIVPPVYGNYAEAPENRHYRLDYDRYGVFNFGDVIVPANIGDFVVSDTAVLASYASAWADYSKAHKVLSALLNGYATREKLVVDFPEYEGYLPEIAAKKNLPAIVVPTVRAELSALGVPAI